MSTPRITSQAGDADVAIVHEQEGTPSKVCGKPLELRFRFKVTPDGMSVRTKVSPVESSIED